MANRREQNTRVPVSRTLVIGLGGTGVAVALHMKREFINHFGLVPAIVKILCFDTDTKFDPLTDIHGRMITLDRNEFVHLAVPDPQTTLQSLASFGQNEFPQGKIRLRALTDGASQVRALGRLSVLANIEGQGESTQGIIDHLNTAIGAILSQAAEDEVRASERMQLYDDVAGVAAIKPITVYIVCSLAGGMGSGSFLDMAYLCRQLLSQTQNPQVHKIIGMFLLPPIFENRPATANIYGNAYAALLELDHLMSQQYRQDGGSINVVYSPTLSVPWHQWTPFDQVYVVDNWNESGNREDRLEYFFQLMGHTLFLNVSVTAESVRANIRGGAQLPDWHGKQAHYAGFGVANIEIPIELVIRETTALVLADFLRSHLVSSAQQKNWEEIVSKFMRSEKIDEDTRDDVIDELLKEPQSVDTKALEDNRGRLVVHKYPDRAQRIKEWIKSQRAKAEEYIKKPASQESSPVEKKMIDLLEDKKPKIDAKVKDLIKKEGILSAKSFLSALEARLKASEKLMDDESKKFDPTSVQYPGEPEIDDACDALLRKRSIEHLVNEVKGKLAEELRLHFERTRRDYAREFFRKLKEHVQAWLEQVSAVSNSIDAALSNLNHEIQTIRDNIAREKFNLLLGYNELRDDIEQLLIAAGIKSQENGRVQYKFIMDQLTPETILSWGDPRAGGQRVIQELTSLVGASISDALHWNDQQQRGLKVDKALQQLYPNEQRLAQVLDQKLIQRASPWWRYNAALAAGRKMFNVLIFGSQFKNNTVCSDDLLQKQLGLTPGSYDVTSTRDPYRLTVLKYRFAVPAYALGGVEPIVGGTSYANRYRADEGVNTTHHIRNQWVSGQGLQPLGPSLGEKIGGTEEAKEYWAVAFAKPFELIRFDPFEGYFILLPQAGQRAKEKKIPLGDNRTEAFRKFSVQPDLIDEIKKRVIEIARAQGVQDVTESLKAYVEEVEAALEKGEFKPDAMTLIEDMELKAIENFMNRLKPKG